MRDWISNHRGMAIGGGVGLVAVIVFVLVWFQPQKLFIDTHVDEALPTVTTMPFAVTTTTVPTTTTTAGSASTTSVATTTTTSTTTTVLAGPTTIASGELVGVAHAGSGTALLIRLEDGTFVLRFEDLDILNGPDLRVILSARPVTGADDYADAEYVDLGALKGNVGNQNYEIPDDIDLSQFVTAAIWCRRFNTTFNAAPLDEA